MESQKSRKLSTNGNQIDDKSFCLMDKLLMAIYMPGSKLSRWLVCLFPNTKTRIKVISQYALKSNVHFHVKTSAYGMLVDYCKAINLLFA